MDVFTLLNTIRANSSALYQERIPEATADNLKKLGGTIINYAPARNEFCDALINKIAFTIVRSRAWKNPLAVLKKERKPFGTDIEDIYINPATGEVYDGNETGDLLTLKKPDIKTMYHRMNRQGKYKVSISVPELQQAFTSAANFEKFLNSKIQSLYNGDEMDEYLLMRNIFVDAVKKNMLPSATINYTGDETTSKELVKAIKILSGDFTFMRNDFNGYNLLNKTAIANEEITPCITWTPLENQILLIRNDVDKSTDVEVLAKAFNMEKTEFLKRKIVVDSFGDTDTLAVLIDDALTEFRDNFYSIEEFHNGSTLTKTYWLHHWQTLSLTLFANGYAIKQATA